MSQSIKEERPSVDAIVGLLAVEADDGTPADLRRRYYHAGEAVDAADAQRFAAALLEHLERAPDDLAELESLVVLWLAHPKALAEHDGRLEGDARRLAALLERQGDVGSAQSLLELLTARDPGDKELDRELASLMQRSGNADRLVERYLRRAEEAIREGQRRDAITWLREVLAIDRSRRDVARMIRDLQYEDAEKRRALRRSMRISAFLFVILAVVMGVMWREATLQQRYSAIAAVAQDDLPGMRQRLDEVDTLIRSSPLWMGAFTASAERAELRVAITRLEALQLQEQRAAEAALRQRLDQADSDYLRGRAAIERGDFQASLAFYTAALEVAPEDWDQRQRLEADVEAIATWLSEHPGQKGQDQ